MSTRIILPGKSERYGRPDLLCLHSYESCQLMRIHNIQRNLVGALERVLLGHGTEFMDMRNSTGPNFLSVMKSNRPFIIY